MEETNNPSVTVKKSSLWKYSTIVLLVVIVIVAIVYINGTKSTGDVISNPPGDNSGGSEIEIGNSPVEGNPNATVTIIEFSDFQCPFCGRNFRQTYPELKKNYIDTGKVKYSFKDFPLEFHENAEKAAETAKCVREQLGDDGFWRIHDIMYNNQASLSIENEKKWAREIGVDGEKFDSCLDSGKMSAAVKEDFDTGQKFGVKGTPAFFINGKPIVGACPYKTFQQAIDAELAGKDWTVDDQCKITVY